MGLAKDMGNWLDQIQNWIDKSEKGESFAEYQDRVRFGKHHKKHKHKSQYTFPFEKYRNYTKGAKYTPTQYTYKNYPAAGCVILAGLHGALLDYFYIVRPSGKFGGNEWVIPKGRIDSGELKELAAIREVKEESGLVVRLLPEGNLGTYEGKMTDTTYFMASRIGGNIADHDWETSEVRLVSFDEAKALFAKDKNSRDYTVTKKAQEYVSKLKKRLYGGGDGDGEDANHSGTA